MCQTLINKKTPPKYAIANGYVIGSFPREIQFTTKDGKRKKRTIKFNEVTDLLKAVLAPVRPFGCVFSYTGGSQKSIKGNYQFFEMDQNRLGAVVNHLNHAGIGKHIYCVLCGRMTPDQKQIVRMRTVVDTQLFIAVLTWFVNESGHPGYQNTTIPEKCPQPLFVEDKEANNNTDELINVNMETTTFVYGSSNKFALAMFQRSAPTLLAYGGTFVNMKEMNIENILPIAFPFGIGGPKMNRKVKVSHEMCIQYYIRRK